MLSDSLCCLQLLSECVVGGLGHGEEMEEEEKEVMSEQSGAVAFQVVGTVSEQLNDDRMYVLEDYFVSMLNINTFVK